MKYKKYTAIILKKQNYKEADQILTLWTREAGKIRVLAKAVRMPKSKLVYNLNELSVVDIEVAGHKNLPVVTSSRCSANFRNLSGDLVKMGGAFYAAELVLKMTADENPNQRVFELLQDFLQGLNETQILEPMPMIDNFALELSETLGFGRPKNSKSHIDVRSFIEQLIERNLKSEGFLTQIRTSLSFEGEGMRER